MASVDNPRWHESEHRLWAALCNFCNDASDDFTPVSQWDDSVRANLSELCKAFNDWHVWVSSQKGDNWLFEADSRPLPEQESA